MPRIRNLTVAGVLAGATVLGGAGLAGATGGAEVEDPAMAQLQEELQQPTTELSTGEGDETTTDGDTAEAPTAPSLPDQADPAAARALAEAPAFGDRSAEPTVESETDAEDAAGRRGDDRAAEPRPGGLGHGPQHRSGSGPRPGGVRGGPPERPGPGRRR